MKNILSALSRDPKNSNGREFFLLVISYSCKQHVAFSLKFTGNGKGGKGLGKGGRGRHTNNCFLGLHFGDFHMLPWRKTNKHIYHALIIN